MATGQIAVASGTDRATGPSNGRRSWKHRSVQALNVDDPIAWVTERARQLVYRAIELGWSGPPFDPLELADLLRLPCGPRRKS